MEYQRKCNSFLQTFRDWNLPRSEVQESMIIWAGLFSLSTALRRRVWIPKTSGLGSWDCYPFLYLMFVAPPGMRKTTTLNYAAELFEGLPDLVQAPNACSQAALSERLSSSPDTSCYIISEEFSDLLLKSGPEMYEFLTSAYDARKKFETSTISRGIEFIEKPCINMGAGTTPIWIANNMPESAIGGGFASRVLFLYENTLRKKTLFHEYDMVLNEKLKEDLTADLRHISKNVAGEFTLEKEAKEFTEAWYQSHMPEKAHPKLQGYYQRKHVHVLKTAMLYRVSYSDELILTTHDVRMALSILESTIEKNLALVFEGIGKNIYTFSMKDISKFIFEQGKVKRKHLLNSFKSVATPSMLGELIQGLIAMGEIEFETDDDGEVYYKVKK